MTECRKLVVASGAMSQPRIPALSSTFPPDIRQYHASQYRNPSQLPEGAVLVVGSGQTGLQITEDLLTSGRTVFLATSAVGRVPRRYRGKDIVHWLLAIGFMDLKTSEATDPALFRMRQPQVSGVGPRGHSHSLQSLARDGAVILGRFDRVEGTSARFRNNAAEYVRFGDQISLMIKTQIDAFIEKNGLDTDPPGSDPADDPDPEAACVSPVTALDLSQKNVRAVIWSTGFEADYSYLKLPVLQDDGAPRQCDGVSDVPGVFFIGMPWVRKRKSGLIMGVAEDAEAIAAAIDGEKRT